MTKMKRGIIMNKKIKGIILAACVSAVMMTIAGCGTKDSLSTNEEKASNKIEGTITLYTSQPDSDAAALTKAFKQKYPDVDVQVFRSGTEEVVSKLLAENEAGSVKADVLLVSDSVTFESLKTNNLLMSYKSSELKGIPEEFIDKDNDYTGTKIISTGIIANTKNVKNLPDSWESLVQSDYKNKTIMPSPLYSGAAAYNVGVLTRTDGIGWNFYNKLKNNGTKVDKGNGTVLTAVASGDKDLGMIVDYMAVREEKKGSPVKFIYPKEGVPAITEPIGIIKSTKNPNAAKALVDFILSEEGQKLEVSLGYTPIKDGVKAPEGLKTYKEMKVLKGDNEELLKSKDVDKKKFSDIFK